VLNTAQLADKALARLKQVEQLKDSSQVLSDLSILSLNPTAPLRAIVSGEARDPQATRKLRTDSEPSL